ncbi:MAG: sulfatase-like hydrolase/transferase [Planctomycetota bacterium]|nr:sulfatase-like hydrolase/transferase [Planctomycetota bacterium]
MIATKRSWEAEFAPYSRLVPLLCIILPCSLVPAKEPKSSSLPNVVLIYTDDQGYGDAANLNPDCKFATPNLDRLAREGLAFTDAHCSDTVCTPSRYGLLTGRYAWRTRLKKGVMGAEGKCLIEDGRLTLPGMLKQKGYATAMVGKWHLGMDFPGESHRDRDWMLPVQDMPLDKGFDYFFGVPASLNYGVLAWFDGRYAKVPPTVFTAKKPNQRHPDYRIMPPYQKSAAATEEVLGKRGMEVAPDFIDNQCLTRFTKQAITWIQGHQKKAPEQPFFLYLPYTSPHYPVCPVPEFHGQGNAGGYGEFMIETDHHVGEILNYLDEADLDENTIVIYTSDNGPEKSWVQRAERFQHQSNFIYRGGKRSIYEGGHRVPFYVRWPAGVAAAGRKASRRVCQTDLLATLAEIVDFELPDSAGEDSQSFAGFLRTAPIAQQTRDVGDQTRLPMIHHAANGRFAIRAGTLKLVMPHGKLQAELYDLADDPSETKDIAAAHPEKVKQMTEKITEIVVKGRSVPGKPQLNDTDWWPDLGWITPVQYQNH